MPGRTDQQELIQFAFESRATAGVPLAALLRMVDGARRFNAQCGLTGELHLTGESFRFVSEGRCQSLLPLAARILADPRHGSIRITAFGKIDRRRFGGWKAVGFDRSDDRDEPDTDVRFFAVRGPVAPRTRAAVAASR